LENLPVGSFLLSSLVHKFPASKPG
jgi:hypothetical protein